MKHPILSLLEWWAGQENVGGGRQQNGIARVHLSGIVNVKCHILRLEIVLFFLSGFTDCVTCALWLQRRREWETLTFARFQCPSPTFCWTRRCWRTQRSRPCFSLCWWGPLQTVVFFFNRAVKRLIFFLRLKLCVKVLRKVWQALLPSFCLQSCSFQQDQFHIINLDLATTTREPAA